MKSRSFVARFSTFDVLPTILVRLDSSSDKSISACDMHQTVSRKHPSALDLSQVPRSDVFNHRVVLGFLSIYIFEPILELTDAEISHLPEQSL